MSTPRSSKEIQSESNNLVFKAGSLQYTIGAQKKDLEKVNAALRDLEFEFIAAKNAENAAEAEKAASEPATKEVT